MRTPILLLLATLALLPAPAGAAPLTNRLAQHPSPYLALHGTDPVAWQEWNAATVARARQEGKLLFVSVGYFTCHWCHVMQRESYKNAEIARYLNAHFIPVKVDRELDPALDARLTDFADKTRGRSGWPLNAFVTPDGHPLYATLYHPPAEFLKVLERIEQLWRGDRARLAQLARVEAVRPGGPGRPEVSAAQARAHAARVVAEALRQADGLQGGFGDQSKFPQVPQLAFLLAEHERAPDARLAAFLTLTLDAMVSRGLHDQLGGGFFRYAVDPSWKTPHFEKMLYDNAQLARLYLDAARVLKRDDYRALGRRTLDFLLREFQAADGGFIAALSALDDRDVEGGYYLWSGKELEAVLGTRELAAYRLHAGMTDAPPFEAGWLPMAALSAAEVARRLETDPAEVERLLRAAADKLRAARARRQLPRDTKVLAAWNGLALSAFTAAAGDDPRYRQAAQALRELLGARLWDGRQLARSRRGGKVALEDYAYVAAGLTDWAQLTGEPGDWALARALAGSAWSRFYGPNGWRLEQDSLLAAEAGQDAVNDGHMPSPSAVLIDTSLRIAAHSGDRDLRRRALGAANSGHRLIEADPFWHATAVAAQLRAARAGR
jgi:uncharacterized protein YyaL (SSP411 family)